ncbi:MAG: ATP-binding cassette domain-containing protein, partial [Stomatobaculum sp.]|nr:ATP-binding cassette domain-containing protein [Stomatobaculum sp.]
ALMGRSGCGKSTLLKLLMCIYDPESGERYYRTAEGEEKVLDSGMRRLFAYVPQGNQLLSGTIRDVVTFSGSISSDDTKIREALRISCAEEFVSDLENEMDSVLGERGTGLSEGQMQRLAIARAVCSGAPVLLLDEATSALDEQTEMKLLSNLREMQDHTVVIVSHRRTTARCCDRVIRL